MVRPTSVPYRWSTLAAIALGACSPGSLEAPAGPDFSDPAAVGDNGGATNGGGVNNNGGGPGGVVGDLGPGRKPPHRLSNTEYNYTIQDLLGTSLTPGDAFLIEEEHGFENIAEALGMTANQFESYFNAAEQVAIDVSSKPDLLARLVPCDIATQGDSCVRSSIADFARRAFRRPVTDLDVDNLMGLYQNARDLGEDEASGIRQVLHGVLASPDFLYRFELDEDPAATEPRALDSYELASRLSYFMWSSLPDEGLFDLADAGALTDPDVLHAEVDRMLEDSRADRLITELAQNWLGASDLSQHQVLSEVYPQFDQPLQNAMVGELEAFFGYFLQHDEIPLKDMWVTDIHFVNDRLAQHYGFALPGTDQLTLIQGPTDDARRGIMGLAGFQTLTSFAHRTSPTLRAKWVLEVLLCSPPPPPPVDLMVTDLDGDEAANAAASIENVRERLELHRTDPLCAGCHASMDPIGLALERFDGIGNYRETYDNGDLVDASGELPGRGAFDGLLELSDLLHDDARFSTCATRTMMLYGLGRRIASSEQKLVQAVLATAEDEGGSLRSLIHAIVDSAAFRMRLPYATVSEEP